MCSKVSKCPECDSIHLRWIDNDAWCLNCRWDSVGIIGRESVYSRYCQSIADRNPFFYPHSTSSALLVPSTHNEE